jgi:hypothetical protein
VTRTLPNKTKNSGALFAAIALQAGVAWTNELRCSAAREISSRYGNMDPARFLNAQLRLVDPQTCTWGQSCDFNEAYSGAAPEGKEFIV